jgi:regulator of nucleoside diphosphate kinase
MNPAHDQIRCVNDADRCRLGRLLVREPGAWVDRTCRANLEVILEQATPVETRATPEDVVTMNTKVKLAALPTEKPWTVTLVYPDDLDLAADGVSILEPLGTALLGCKVGDVVQCSAAKGAGRFCIVEIIYQPEHAGSFHL